MVVTSSSPAWLCWVLQLHCCYPTGMKKFPTTCPNNLFDDTAEWTMFWQQSWGNYRASPPCRCLGWDLAGLENVDPWKEVHGAVSCVTGALMGSFSCQFVNTRVRQCRTFWIMRHNLFVVWTDCQKNCWRSIENSLCPKGKIKDVFPNMTKLEPTHVGLKDTYSQELGSGDWVLI